MTSEEATPPETATTNVGRLGPSVVAPSVARAAARLSLVEIARYSAGAPLGLVRALASQMPSSSSVVGNVAHDVTPSPLETTSQLPPRPSTARSPASVGSSDLPD